jgi:hypothetical protein
LDITAIKDDGGKNTAICNPGQARCLRVMLLLFLMVNMIGGTGAVPANSDGRIEVLTGYIPPEGGNFYDLPDLATGDMLYVYVEQISGNLDPYAALMKPGVARQSLRSLFEADVEEAIAQGRDPFLVIPEFSDRYFLAWDDDSGEGYASSFEYAIPGDGTYILLVTNSPAEMERFGDYRLLIGINAPEVLSGEGQPTGDSIAILDRERSGIDIGVEEVNGTLPSGKAFTYFNLDPINKGDTLYAYIEPTSGDLVPFLVLTDFGDKSLSAGLPAEGKTHAMLEYTFTYESNASRLEIYRTQPGSGTEGDFRLLVGVNDPAVLTGNATPRGRDIVLEPIVVKVGYELDQITTVDQQSENYGVVANIWMEWTDPELAFSPDECQCNFKLYRSVDEFVKAEGTRWPEFTLFNQQERRWTQNQLIIVRPDGQTRYIERFWVILQAPDFNFRQYPFDNQLFFARIDSIYPEELYIYEPWDERTQVGSQLGEEEWYITEWGTNVTSINLGDNLNSRFSFEFTAARHLLYYLIRILLPIAIIIVLTYIPFLLTDYGKRADIASANLLLFIAFNFTIAGDLPRLGYLTLLDALLMTTFVMSGLTVIYNLYLKWLATKEQLEIAGKIDRIAIWAYPLTYVVLIISIVLFFR